MPRIFKLDIEQHRTATIYVMADTKEAAKADAEELASTWNEWDEFDLDWYLTERQPRLEDDWVFTGGPSGDMLLWKEVEDQFE
jgi:hypothetical protein